jgi:hypothetical protein
MAERINKFLLLLVISLAARGFFIFCFPHCYSLDIKGWNDVGDILLAGGNPYNLTSTLNWPPFWMQLIFCFKKISLLTHWPFVNVVRGFLILVESALMLVLYVTVIQFTQFKKITWLLMLGIALNPISILQVCQHCNFDVLVGFWVLLAVHMLLRFHERHESRFWLFACFALGMGAATKTVPLSLALLLLPAVKKLKLTEQILGAAFLLVPLVLGMSIIYVLGPKDIESKVLGYRSIPGDFGFSGLFTYLHADGLLAIWPCVFLIIYGTGWICLGVWLLFKETLGKREIVSIAAVVLLAIPTLGPGYGPQYIYWFLPLFVLMYGLAERIERFFLLVLYGIAAVTYLMEYALNYNTFGGFFLDIIQTEKLLKFAMKLSSKTGETFLRLPLWIGYLTFVAYFCTKIGMKMAFDLKAALRQKQVANSATGDRPKLF